MLDAQKLQRNHQEENYSKNVGFYLPQRDSKANELKQNGYVLCGANINENNGDGTLHQHATMPH